MLDIGADVLAAKTASHLKHLEQLPQLLAAGPSLDTFAGHQPAACSSHSLATSHTFSSNPSLPSGFLPLARLEELVPSLRRALRNIHLKTGTCIEVGCRV